MHQRVNFCARSWSYWNILSQLEAEYTRFENLLDLNQIRIFLIFCDHCELTMPYTISTERITRRTFAAGGDLIGISCHDGSVEGQHLKNHLRQAKKWLCPA